MVVQMPWFQPADQTEFVPEDMSHLVMNVAVIVVVIVVVVAPNLIGHHSLAKWFLRGRDRREANCPISRAWT